MDCIVAGGSGLVGQSLLAELSADPSIERITAVTRGPLFKKLPKVEVMKISFEQLEILELPPAFAAFCCLGTTIKKAGSREVFYRIDHDYVINFAKACQRAGIQRFYYVSAAGADPASKIFYNQVKGRTEADLLELQFEKLVIIRPSLLLGDRREKRHFEKAAQFVGKYLKRVMVGPLQKVRPVEATEVARKLKTAAIRSESSNKVQVIANEQI